MPKIKYTVPKGSKDCNGQECKQDLQFDIDIPETKPTTQIIPTPQIDYSNLAQLQTQPLIPAADHTHKHEETKKLKICVVLYVVCVSVSIEILNLNNV